MSLTQLKLFDITIDEQKLFEQRSRVATTFKGSLAEPVHRWFRLTPSFSPVLVRDIFDTLELRPSQRVLDPYSGTGTVPLEACRRGNVAVSVEINPGLHFVSQVKTSVYEPRLVEADLMRFLELWQQALLEIKEPAAYLLARPDLVPNIAYPERWWAIGTLAQLAAARLVLQQSQLYHYPHLVQFAIGSIVMEVSAARHNHPSVSFAAGPAIEKDALKAYVDKCGQIIPDLVDEAMLLKAGSVEVYYGNTKNAATLLAKEERFDVVVTSPPYPNRYSYARETRPFLFFLDLVATAAEVGIIETEALGGTWGRATWLLKKEIVPANPVLEKLLQPFIDGIKDSNPVLKHYVVRYFNDIWTHIEQLSQVMRPNARMVWVVGNALMLDNPVTTVENLVVIFSQFGWQADSIVDMRKRHSKRGLRESIIFLTKR